MSTLPSIAAAIGAGLFILWKVFRDYFVSYQIDNLPGPQPVSFLFGASLTISVASGRIAHLYGIGNLPQLTTRQSWRLWAQYADSYGPAFLVRSLLSVRIVNLPPCIRDANSGNVQRRVLVLHDPKALHTVMVKDQDVWRKGLEPSKYVL